MKEYGLNPHGKHLMKDIYVNQNSVIFLTALAHSIRSFLRMDNRFGGRKMFMGFVGLVSIIIGTIIGFTGKPNSTDFFYLGFGLIGLDLVAEVSNLQEVLHARLTEIKQILKKS